LGRGNENWGQKGPMKKLEAKDSKEKLMVVEPKNGAVRC
jgi:hypothetical protein